MGTDGKIICIGSHRITSPISTGKVPVLGGDGACLFPLSLYIFFLLANKAARRSVGTIERIVEL